MQPQAHALPRSRSPHPRQGLRRRGKAGPELPTQLPEAPEFKTFIRPCDRKEHEIAETVVAFANTEGGTIYVGVDDYGELVGAAELRGQWKNTQNPVEEAAKRLRKLIADGVKPGAPATVANVMLQDAPLLVVQVLAGNRRPYATQKDEIFVRKGATNRRPDPHTELHGLMPESGVP